MRVTNELLEEILNFLKTLAPTDNRAEELLIRLTFAKTEQAELDAAVDRILAKRGDWIA